MAVRSKGGISGKIKIESKPKKTRQGRSNHTKLSASSGNGKQKRYRGQGRWLTSISAQINLKKKFLI